MFNLFYLIFRFILFRLDAERSHDLTLSWLRKLQAGPCKGLLKQKLESDPVELFGLAFPNRVGLAAGLDKNGECIDAFAAQGFGHIEIGTVTPRPQPGNPKPRLFRVKNARALINRFGFNNVGVDELIENVKEAKYEGILGINIGKNFDTPVESAEQDYLICLDKVYQYASYITVNISSPNTANLRQLQFGDALESLLSAIKLRQSQLTDIHEKRVPVLVKIAPDLEADEINLLADTFVKHQVDGVIATNTTSSRRGVEGLKFAEETGGLSGAPLFSHSTEVLRKFCSRINGAFPVIGVGGIDSVEAAQAKIEAGASLVQVYSGLIYRGPGMIKRIGEALSRG